MCPSERHCSACPGRRADLCQQVSEEVNHGSNTFGTEQDADVVLIRGRKRMFDSEPCPREDIFKISEVGAAENARIGSADMIVADLGRSKSASNLCTARCSTPFIATTSHNPRRSRRTGILTVFIPRAANHTQSSVMTHVSQWCSRMLLASEPVATSRSLCAGARAARNGPSVIHRSSTNQDPMIDRTVESLDCLWRDGDTYPN